MAVNKDTGTVHTMAIVVTHKVPNMKGRNPKSPRIGFHFEVRSSSPNVFSSRMGRDLMISPAPMSTSSRTETMVNVNMAEPAILSFNRRNLERWCTFGYAVSEIISFAVSIILFSITLPPAR